MLKSETLYGIAEITRALTPYWFAGAGAAIVLTAISNSDKLVGDRFVYTIGAGTTFLAAGAGGYSPQNRQQPQTKINEAQQVEIDNK